MGWKRKQSEQSQLVAGLAGWDPSVKDNEVEVEYDPLTGGHYKVSCNSTHRAWIGVRGRPGVVGGAYCFEVKVSEGLLRVGWSSGSASLALGTDCEGFGFGGTGKKSHRNKFVDYGSTFEAGDVITCCIDRTKRELSFGANGNWYGKAFDIPKSWDGVALFPALCAREAFKATGYFGCPDHPKVPHGCGFWPLGGAYASDVSESLAGPPAAVELPGVAESSERRLDRADRFSKVARVDRDLEKLSHHIPDASVQLVSQGPLVGRSRALERGYLRDAEKLQDPDHIRPLPVLKEALAHALSAKRPWSWEAEMLRAIRQDLIIQHADIDFVEEVAEISALRALANGDWPVFAACAPSVHRRPRAGELAWLLMLGNAPLARSCTLQKMLDTPFTSESHPIVDDSACGVKHRGLRFCDATCASLKMSNEDFEIAMEHPDCGFRCFACGKEFLSNAARKSMSQACHATAIFVRSVLANMSMGRWTSVLRQTPPNQAATQAFSIIVRPVAMARALAATTKAFPKVRRETLGVMGIVDLPADIEVVDGIVNGTRAHVHALTQLKACLRPIHRDDHSFEFLR